MTFLNLDNCFFGRTDIFFACVFEINKTLQQCSFGISVILIEEEYRIISVFEGRILRELQFISNINTVNYIRLDDICT